MFHEDHWPWLKFQEVTCAPQPQPPPSPPSHLLSWILIGLLALMFLYSCLITAFYIRLTMETSQRDELCFPQLFNKSCRKPTPAQSDVLLANILQSFIALITAALNLLVIISISHFRHRQISA
ncbi:hypothetical protein NQZ68_034592 [Dissostichus eleginoides]|nr:hypothetical protein NQZ68_034592 [Dissostichus eleginoides]